MAHHRKFIQTWAAGPAPTSLRARAKLNMYVATLVTNTATAVLILGRGTPRIHESNTHPRNSTGTTIHGRASARMTTPSP